MKMLGDDDAYGVRIQVAHLQLKKMASGRRGNCRDPISPQAGIRIVETSILKYAANPVFPEASQLRHFLINPYGLERSRRGGALVIVGPCAKPRHSGFSGIEMGLPGSSHADHRRH